MFKGAIVYLSLLLSLSPGVYVCVCLYPCMVVCACLCACVFMAKQLCLLSM